MLKDRQYVFSKVRCPVCRMVIEPWNEVDDYRTGVRTKYYKCKCGYERVEYEKFKK